MKSESAPSRSLPASEAPSAAGRDSARAGRAERDPATAHEAPLTSRDKLFLKLAAEREFLTPDEARALALSGRFRHDVSSGVSLWFDPSHVRGAADRKGRAARAITETGDLVWFCWRPSCPRPIVVACAEAAAALAAADTIWARPAKWHETFFGRGILGKSGHAAMFVRPLRGFEGLC